MKLSGLSLQLAEYLAKGNWTSKGHITDTRWVNRKNGVRYLPETVGRALRRLEEGSILAVKKDGKSVQYKWIPHEMRTHYIPTSERQGDKLFK